MTKLRQTPDVLSPCPCLYKTLPKEVCTNSEALVQELSANEQMKPNTNFQTGRGS